MKNNVGAPTLIIIVMLAMFPMVTPPPHLDNSLAEAEQTPPATHAVRDRDFKFFIINYSLSKNYC